MRFLHIVLAASLVLTTEASDDPIDNSGSENPTGRAAVHGHPKVKRTFVGEICIEMNELNGSHLDNFFQVAAESSGYQHDPPPNLPSTTWSLGGYKAPVQDLVSFTP